MPYQERARRLARVNTWLALILVVLGSIATWNTYRANVSVQDRAQLHAIVEQLQARDRAFDALAARVDRMDAGGASMARRIEALEAEDR